MIRLVQRKLIIPRGDTGSFTIPILANNFPDVRKVGVLSIFNDRERIFQKKVDVVDKAMTFEFSHEETKELPLGTYYWDIKLYVNPNEEITDADQVHSYYAGFTLPECEIALAPYERG